MRGPERMLTIVSYMAPLPVRPTMWPPRVHALVDRIPAAPPNTTHPARELECPAPRSGPGPCLSSLVGELRLRCLRPHTGASIAHEVNQPLAAVVTSANACERWLAGNAPNIEKARDALGRIVKAGMMASEVVARNRALFQKSASERQRLDVNEVIREATDLLRDEAMRHGVSIKTELAADLPPVLADRRYSWSRS